jgi:uncharacterized protein
VFVRELIPSRVVALVARLLYNEPYEVVPLRSVTETSSDRIRVVHEFLRAGRPQRIAAEGRRPAEPVADNGPTHFFKEHAWGYGTDRRGDLLRYAVDHPRWRVFPDATAQVELEFATVYGSEWGFLTDVTPEHVAFAEGSVVAVYPGERGRGGAPT